MRINDQDWSIFSVVRALFPLQLFFSHLKHNFISLIFWAILFAIINDSWGSAFGVPYLFLSPEYLHEISFGSFLLLGFALGGFVMGFNTYSYIRLGPLYPFLITLNRPFYKFCINNSLIPLIFVINYLINMGRFQLAEEFANMGQVLLFSLAFLLGIAIFMTLSWLFFFRLIKYNPYQPGAKKPFKTMTYQNSKWYDVFKKQREYRTLYFGKRFKLKPSRSSKHFDRELVESIFAKNRVSASLYEIITILIFFGLGFFNSYDLFEVPAATSIVLLFTICLMLYSALHSWLKGWFYPILMGVLLMMNYMSQNSGMFHYTSYAFGLDYSDDKKEAYNVSVISAISNDSTLNASSYQNYLTTLENWKTRTGEEKPKLIIINTSGGGSRSALWTTSVMQELDLRTHGKISRHTQLITGASGGMVGAAYYREIYLQNLISNKPIFSAHTVRTNMGKDILNKLSFMASTNDIFVRYQNVEYKNQRYTKDRGYAFEEQLLANTDHVLDHDLGYYRRYETSGVIPTMIFTPTIINDGRRMFIGSQSLNFLASGEYAGLTTAGIHENIDIRSLFKTQNIDNLRFSSVLRASATFPFVMPMITLPTVPEIQLMDAGIRDNYGAKTMMLFLHSMEDWIHENTSGVIIIEIRDTRKVYDNETFKQVSFLDKLTLPFGNMYKNFPRVQNYNQEELVQLSKKSLKFPIETISFNLMQQKDERISLSWHLTSAEKIKILKALYSDSNQQALFQILKSLESMNMSSATNQP